MQTKEDIEDMQIAKNPQPVTYEPIKPTEKPSTDSRQAMLYVRMAGSTSDGVSSGGADSSSSHSDSIVSSEGSEALEDGPEIWHDCADSQEWFEAGTDAQQRVSGTVSAVAAAAEASALLTEQQRACLQALPARLGALLTKYLSVRAS